MSESLLAIRDLKVAYAGAGLGVQGLSLDVRAGEIVAMLGANGAGKTTTLRAISGFLPGDIARVSGGTIHFNGRKLGTSSPHVRVRQGMSIVPEREKVFRTLTVDENLQVCARGGNSKQTFELIYDLFPALAERRDVTAGLLSGGERQMLAIGRALMSEPKLLLADEVSLGIAPGLVLQLLDKLKQINQERGVTILVVEQNAAAALRVADRVYVLEHGAAVLEGTPKELLQREDFFSVYFGLRDDPSHEVAHSNDVERGAE